jgi:predicted Zn-dependent protease
MAMHSGSNLPAIFILLLQLCALSCASIAPFDGSVISELAEDERRLWNRSREEAKRLDLSGALHDSVELSEYVNGIAKRLWPNESGSENLTPSVKVLKNPFLNAFALPHGVVYIHSGLLAKIETEAQLAAILSHELVHITHRHALQHFRGIQNTSVALATVQMAGMPFGIFGALGTLLGSLGATAAVNGYSRSLETEADQKGFESLVNAGYDPAEAPRLFEFLEAELEDRKINEPFFFGSHPRLAERKENWANLVKQRFPQKSGERGAERYAEKIQPILLETALMDLSQGRWSWAEETIKRYITLDPRKPEGHFLMGELFRRRGGKDDHRRAERQYRTAIDLDPAYAAPYGGLGRIYLSTGKPTDAHREFANYLRLAPLAEDRAYIENYITRPVESNE